MKVDIENRFKNFSIENKELVNSLKDEIIDCYKNGLLIKQAFSKDRNQKL